MNRSEIIFDNLIALLNNFLLEPGLEAFITGLPESEEIAFVGITEQIRTFIDDLATAKTSDTFPLIYSNLQATLNSLESTFSAFSFSGANEIRFLAIISALLADESIDLTDKNPINEVNDFELGRADKLDSTLISTFIYENVTHSNQSVLVIDFSKPQEFNSYINTNRPSALLLLTLADKLTVSSAVSKNKYVLVKSGSLAHMPSTISAILFHCVSAGLSFHHPKDYTSFTPNSWRDLISISNKYQQFNSTLYVLSEYNKSSDILSKYLLIYHIFEDYMYKSLLVNLEGVNSGKMFSMRDFSRMNESISKRELDALNTFVKKLASLSYATGIYADDIYTKWTTFTSTLNAGQKTDIEVILNYLSIRADGTFTIDSIVNKKELINTLARIIYMIRNSIVHNKSTEFHLTYVSLNESMSLFMNEFLIPCLERTVFFITTDPLTELVWFKHSSLSLWEN